MILILYMLILFLPKKCFNQGDKKKYIYLHMGMWVFSFRLENSYTKFVIIIIGLYNQNYFVNVSASDVINWLTLSIQKNLNIFHQLKDAAS